ncbi:MAG TPA: hypothetical protein VHX64_15580 [Caulobacteraceae bacterium]|nr:hypothetical protein [Caulobacteraceae bacterium]
MIAKVSAFTLAALAALALAGCGKQGELERPAPLFGHQVQPDRETHDRQAAAARAKEDAGPTAGKQAPESEDEVRGDDNQLPPPPPVMGRPVPGQQAGPNPQPPPGGLPDPLHPSSIPQ